MELTGLPSDRLSFADFLNRIRTDFRFRIGEEIATLEQPYVYDMTFPILCPKGEIWIHIKKTSSGKKMRMAILLSQARYRSSIVRKRPNPSKQLH